MNLQPEERIIVAADVSNLSALEELLQRLDGRCRFVKVGLQLLTAVGAPAIVARLNHYDVRVFLDGKLCDIPNTVGEAAKETAELGVYMFNVHATCGIEAMAAAATNKGASKLLAVTLLTSLSADNVVEMGWYDRPVSGKTSPVHMGKEQQAAFMASVVARLAQNAYAAGCDGIICSPADLPYLMCLEGVRNMIKVCPGVRPAWSATGDQKRFTTPAQAIENGADYLVIGRPITGAENPAEAFDRVYKEIAGVSS